MLKKHNIRTRLFVVFGIIILLFLTSIAVSLYEIDEIANKSQMLYNHPFKVSNSVKDIDIDVNYINRNMRDLLSENNKNEIKKEIKNIDAADERIENNFNIVFDQFLGNKELVQNAFLSYQELRKLINTEIEIIQTKTNTVLLKNIEQLRFKKVEQVSNQIKLINKFAQNKALLFFTKTQLEHKKTQVYLFSGSIFLIILCIAFALFISYHITHPIRKFASTVKDLLKSDEIDISPKISETELLEIATTKLTEAYHTIKNFNTELEEKVKERTFELNAKNQEYAALNEEYLAINEEYKSQNDNLHHSYKKLADSELNYKDLFDYMSEAFALHEIIVDENNKPIDYKFLKINPAFEKLLNKPKEEVVGFTLCEIFPGTENDEVNWIQKYGNVALKGETISFESYSECNNKWFSVNAYSPKQNYFAVMFTDITERKKSELELKKQNEEYSALNEEYLSINEEYKSQNESLYHINKKLLESEQRFRLMYENTNIAIGVIGLDYEFKQVNKAFCNFLGYTEQEFIGKTIQEITHPEVLEQNIELQNKLKQGLISSYILQKSFIHKDGNTVYGLLNATLIKNDDNAPSYFVGYVQDITYRIKAENELKKQNEEYASLNEEYLTINEAYKEQNDELFELNNFLKLSEEKFKKAFNNSPVIFSISSLETGEYIQVNNTFYDKFNLSPDEVIGIPANKVLILDSDFREQNLTKLKLESKVENVETQIKTFNGIEITALISAEILEINGEKYNLTTAVDITKRKRAEQKIREVEEKFRVAFHSSIDSININALDGTYIEINQGFTEITGFTREEVIGKTSKKIDIWAISEERIKMVEELKTKGECIDFETNFRCKNGTLKVGLMNAKIIYLDKKPCILSVTKDISKRKEAEQEIQKLSTAVEQSANSIVITDTDGNISYVNTKFTEVSGYSKEEAMGINPRILKSGTQSKEFYQDLWKTISSGNVWRGIFNNKTKLGNFYWELAIITPIKNENDKIINYIAIKEDITKQKQLEQEILKISLITQENERKRFARDLHDEIGPLFSTLKLYFSLLAKTTKKETKIAMQKEVNEVIKDGISIIKTISSDLSPNLLYDFGVYSALKLYISKVTPETHIKITLNTNDENRRTSENIEVNLFRIIKELINNSIKYSEANKIKIEILYKPELIEMIYCDNGIGFDFQEHKKNPKESSGILNIIQRTQSINGIYNVLSDKNVKGFEIEIKIPFLAS